MKTALTFSALLMFTSVSLAAIEFTDEPVDVVASSSGGSAGSTGVMNGEGGRTDATASAMLGTNNTAIGSSEPTEAAGTIGAPGESNSTTSGPGNGTSGGNEGGGDTGAASDGGAGTPQAVPEPATMVMWSLLAICAFGVVRLSRRRG